jgi:hypothetical protein
MTIIANAKELNPPLFHLNFNSLSTRIQTILNQLLQHGCWSLNYLTSGNLIG